MEKQFSVFDKVKQLLHPILLKMMPGRRNFPIEILDEIPKTDGNKIYVMNHSNVHDIPIACEVIEKHSYVLIGKQSLDIIDRLFFRLNGVVYIDRKNKGSKKRGFEKMLRVLNRGNNLLLYPEGTWNMTPSKPMLPLNWGVIELAKKSGIPIVPLVTEYHKDCCYISFGGPIFVGKDCDKKQEIERLTDIMATMKWEIWERFPIEKRNEKMQADFEKMIAENLKEYPRFNLEYEMSLVRK